MSKFKVGDLVRVVKASTENYLEVGDDCVIWECDGSDIPFRVLSDRPQPMGHSAQCIWFRADELELVSPASEPRLPWAALREAADVEARNGEHGSAANLRWRANRLEAASRPKPTLSEAVDAFLAGGDLKALREAREREAGK